MTRRIFIIALTGLLLALPESVPAFSEAERKSFTITRTGITDGELAVQLSLGGSATATVGVPASPPRTSAISTAVIVFLIIALAPGPSRGPCGQSFLPG